MSYVKTINEDGVVSDIMAVALDPTLDATILKNSNLVNGFTQTTAGVNALDAAAGKTLNDNKANKSAPTLYFKIGTQDGDPQSSYPHVELRSSGNSTSGRSLSVQYYTASDSSTGHFLIDKNGNFVPEIQTQIDGILGLLPFYFLFASIGGNASQVFTVPNNTSIWVLWASGNNSTNGIASMRLVDSNNANFQSINAGSGSTTPLSAAWNTSTGKLTLSNSGGAALRCFIFAEKQLT